jgi:Fe-S oxidoreductase
VSSWLLRSRLGRWLNEKLLGIDRRRLPPAFARRTARRPEAASADPARGRPVLLFRDTFVRYYGPEVEEAARTVLARAGARVEGPADLACCGRPFISNGMLDDAVACARHNVERLAPHARRGGAVLACEPSCVLTIKDDYPALLRAELRAPAEAVASACLTFEEYLEELFSAGEQALFRPGPKAVLVQGHCHQRSLVGMGPTLRLLRRIPGAEVIDLDAGCCGMAGSFGYEVEHYEVSRLVGEQKLFPALRQASADAVVVAPGFSCRLQIEHFTGRRALHPAELLAGVL